jgi:hypothetical protein
MLPDDPDFQNDRLHFCNSFLITKSLIIQKLSELELTFQSHPFDSR